MLTLHLGVVDLPYPHETEGTTTGDVAEFLEAKYHVMQTFYDAHEQDVAEALSEGMRDVLEATLMGAPAKNDPFLAGTTGIESLFHRFLESGEIEALGVEGVPTQAAKDRKSLRHKKKVNPRPRPSFIDTGLYDASFKAWVEDWTQSAASTYQGAF